MPIAVEDITDIEDLAAWLRRELGRLEWSQADLARRTGISPGRISEWLSGQRNPGPESCARLADALNADIDYLLTLAGHRPSLARDEADGERSTIMAMVRRLRLTQDRVDTLRSVLSMWIRNDREQEGRSSADRL